jgi:hypothetical protein
MVAGIQCRPGESPVPVHKIPVQNIIPEKIEGDGQHIHHPAFFAVVLQHFSGTQAGVEVDFVQELAVVVVTVMKNLVL